MDYLNIKKNGQTIMAPDKVYKKTELIKKFIDFITSSGFEFIKWIKNFSTPYECEVLSPDKIDYDLVLYLKNITGAGWKTKPDKKRAQVSNIRIVAPEDYIPTSKNKSVLILGYYNFDNNPLMVAWDAYRYIKHNTIRSTYISVDNLKRGYQSGYIVTTDASQKVWIFDEKHFDKFLKDYITYNTDK